MINNLTSIPLPRIDKHIQTPLLRGISDALEQILLSVSLYEINLNGKKISKWDSGIWVYTSIFTKMLDKTSNTYVWIKKIYLDDTWEITDKFDWDYKYEKGKILNVRSFVPKLVDIHPSKIDGYVTCEFLEKDKNKKELYVFSFTLDLIEQTIWVLTAVSFHDEVSDKEILPKTVDT